ncbi:Spy/CpxP family protein refolding chaperone [Candidatus Omnitrophota bacterium]
MNRRIVTVLLLMVFVSMFVVSASSATKEVAKPPALPSGTIGGTVWEDDTLEGKLYKDIQTIRAHSDKLKITNDQMKQIKALRVEVRKTIIQMDAGIETLSVEINTMMWETPFDMDMVNNLLAQKNDQVEERDKYIVDAHDRLYKILTPDQKNLLKSYRDRPTPPAQQKRQWKRKGLEL